LFFLFSKKRVYFVNRFKGANHPVDSTEIAFILAAEGAMKQAFTEGKWQIIEPIMLVEVTGPEEFQNAIMGNINKRSGVVINSDTVNGWFTILCEVALNDMFGYCKFFLFILYIFQNQNII
jgi:elongation factor G